MNEKKDETEVTEKKKPEPLPYEPDGEILDWDAYIPPPKRPRRTIQVRLVYKGRGKPLPVPDPDDEIA